MIHFDSSDYRFCGALDGEFTSDLLAVTCGVCKFRDTLGANIKQTNKITENLEIIRNNIDRIKAANAKMHTQLESVAKVCSQWSGNRISALDAILAINRLMDQSH